MAIKESRATRIAIEGSPTFSWSNSSIAASGTWLLDLTQDATNPAAAMYYPFDSVVVSNSSASDLQVDVGAHSLMVPANTIKTKTGIGFESVKITNLDSVNSIAANKLRVSAWREPITEDTHLRRRMLGYQLPYQRIYR